jgi:hypothetical protein
MSMFSKDFEMRQQYFDKKYLFISLLQYLLIAILLVKIAQVTRAIVLHTGGPRYLPIHIRKIGLKGQISSQNVSFYLRIQYSRSKIAGRMM